MELKKRVSIWVLHSKCCLISSIFVKGDINFCSPSHEWQDQVVAMLRNPGSNSHSYVPSSTSSDPSLQRRQRRRISSDSELGSGSHSFSHARHDSHDRGTSILDHDGNRAEGYNQSDDSDDIMDAVGQLSLNEDEQVRYHGKASGLHLLDGKDRIDRRNEGGIWFVHSFFLLCYDAE